MVEKDLVANRQFPGSWHLTENRPRSSLALKSDALGSHDVYELTRFILKSRPFDLTRVLRLSSLLCSLHDSHRKMMKDPLTGG